MRYLLLLPMLLFTFISNASQVATLTTEFTSKISTLESKSSGRLGVSVISANGSTLYSYRENERFAMCSTFKALLGAAILSSVDASIESLDRPIAYTSRDILGYAPITKTKLSKGNMTVSELTAASIQYSDNTAANLLLTAEWY